MAAADASGAKVPLGRKATEIYEEADKAGLGGKDFGSIFTTL